MAEASGSPPLTGTGQELLAEHRQIRHLTDQIEACRDLSELLRHLGTLHAWLVPHFLAEEGADGFYELIRHLSPRQLGRVEELRREHGALLSAVDEAAARARACLAGPVAATLEEARALARQIRAHEAGEDDLLLETMYTDLGHGD